jgi:hypothetical protein
MMIPPRFRTKEDALTFMECLQKGLPISPEIFVPPFRKLPNGDCITNFEYRDAPYEMGFLDKRGKVWKVLG